MEKPRLKLSEKIDHILQVNYPDPDIARRGRLFNILLLTFGIAGTTGGIVGVVFSIADGWTHQDEILLVVAATIMLIFIFALYLFNRAGHTRVAPIIFLLGVTVLISFSDEPQYLVAGRSTMVYVLPIIMASVLMRPSASFAMATVSSVAMVGLAVAYHLDPAPLYSTVPVEIIQFFIIALVGWLAARGLENALAELRKINQELDQRVADRTQELAEALIHLQTESRKTNAILESIADGVIVFDAAGKATVSNPAMAHLLAVPMTRIVGCSIESLMGDVVSRAEQELVLQALHDWMRRVSALRVQWGPRTLAASFAPIRLEDEGGSGSVAVFRDITHEAELDRMKSLFVSTVSHELRTPLSAILGYTEILHEQVHGPLTEKQFNVVERLNANAKRLLSMVNDLLDRARLEAGKLQLRVTAFSPATLLDDLLSATTHLAAAKQLELTTHVAPEVPARLQGDPQRLLQILINLVGNALKFTEQGAVKVRLYCPDASHWAMQVADTGIGILPEEQPHVFDMFRQADSSATRRHGGVGLGLSIVKQLVTLMGGEITLVSEVSRGSVFTVILPLTPAVEEK